MSDTWKATWHTTGWGPDPSDGAMVQWGTVRLVNDGGVWEGPTRGSSRLVAATSSRPGSPAAAGTPGCRTASFTPLPRSPPARDRDEPRSTPSHRQPYGWTNRRGRGIRHSSGSRRGRVRPAIRRFPTIVGMFGRSWRLTRRWLASRMCAPDTEATSAVARPSGGNDPIRSADATHTGPGGARHGQEGQR